MLSPSIPSHALRLAILYLLAALSLGGCSVRQIAADRLGDGLASDGTVFSSDDDPDLIRAASPFSLKLMESVLAERPEHRPLLTVLAGGFTQYAYAFVQQEADETEDKDIKAAFRMRERARKLYRRARDYGLRGLEVGRPDFAVELRKSPAAVLARTGFEDVPLLYWTGAAWAAGIALSKDDPDAVGDVPVMTAMMERALALDETFDAGALHSFFITFAMARPDAGKNAEAEAREHFRRALELSGGNQAGPYLALAEAVAVPKQNRKEFDALLAKALAVSPDERPEWRLSNLIMQHRAKWLLERAGEIFNE